MINLFVPTKKNEYKPVLLRNGALCVYTALLLLVNTFGGLIGISDVSASSISSANIINLANQERVKYGLNELKSNSKLAAAALAKANNMLSVGYWSHFGPNGETPWQFIKSSGYTYVYAGENLAKGFRTAEGVHEAWMASPTHRENILSGNYLEIGVAVVNGNLLGDDVTLVVQMFGNQTNMTVQSPKTAATATQNEPGETSSISIKSPTDGVTINDVGIDLKGTTKGISDNYTVEITDKNIPVGAFETNSKDWQWDKKSDWSEGNHTVSVKVKGNKNISDTVKFTIDSSAPTLSNFEAKSGTINWEISGKLDDIKGSLSLVSGDFIQTAKIEKDGSFKMEIPKTMLGEKITIITADNLGNSSSTDVSDYFKLDNEGNVLSGFSIVMNSLGKKDTLNTIFLGFILLLLVIEVVTYWRRGLLAKHGGNLFTLGFWWLLVLVGVVGGFGGGIS